MSGPDNVDIVVIGAGAAGLTFAHRLATAGPAAPTVALVEPSDGDRRRPAPRTWCFWEPAGGPYDDLLTASWDSAALCSTDGTLTRHALGRQRYKMLDSETFRRAVHRRLDRCPNFRHVTGVAGEVFDTPAHVLVPVDTGAATRTLRARWVLDSRPRPPRPNARTALLQHFRGWFVTTDRPAFDPRVPLLMDFRVPQPAAGLAFGYILPLDECRALVEYTVFSRLTWPEPAYDPALRGYLRDRIGTTGYRIDAVEHGVVPMTDATYPRRESPRHIRIGTSGGATRPSTGYSFAASRRQADAAARYLLDGKPPVPPRPHPRRHLALDAVLLRALDQGRIGPDFFTTLFRANPAETVLRFLDGASTARQELAIGLHSPLAPMLRSCLDIALHRARRRPAAPAHAPEHR
ncbi:lycopene cyclase family protein [Kitasatospora sp. NPDC058201]|uniref:lycopene cyclase family protein n=1 Tax=unclassified Kitasatospora TaxID=2633591 RepID=UPI00364AA69B